MRIALVITLAACSSPAPSLVADAGTGRVSFDASSTLEPDASFIVAVATSRVFVACGGYTDIFFDVSTGVTGAALVGLAPGVTADSAVLGATRSSIRIHASADAPLSQTNADLLVQAPGLIDAHAPVTIVVETGDGTPDSTFGVDGVLAVNVNAPLALATSGESAFVVSKTNFDAVAVARLNDDGSADATFGPDGYAFGSFGSTTVAKSIAIASAGTIAVAATAANDAGNAAPAGFLAFDANGNALAAFATTDISPATWSGANLVAFAPQTIASFPSGITLSTPQFFTPTTLAVRGDGSVLAAGPETLRRFVPESDGSFTLDATFNAAGGTVLAVDDQDRAFVANNGMLTRLDASGHVDTTFGTGGAMPLTQPTSLMLRDGSSFIVIGTTTIAKTTDTVLLLQRIDFDGNPAATFGAFGATQISGLALGGALSAGITPGKLWVLIAGTLGTSALLRFQIDP